MITTVRRDVDVGGNVHRVFRAPGDTRAALNARGVRQRERLPRLGRGRLNGACGADAGALVAAGAATEVDDREAKPCGGFERVRLGEDAGFQTLREKTEHVANGQCRNKKD